jgi:hypothetical protein
MAAASVLQADAFSPAVPMNINAVRAMSRFEVLQVEFSYAQIAIGH